MKNFKLSFKLIVSFAITICFFSSCQNDDEQFGSKEETEVITKVNENDPFVLKLKKHFGFKTENIKDFKDFYLVENDMIFYKKSINDNSLNITAKNAHADFLVGMNKVNNITLKIDVSIPQNSGWIEAVSTAVNEWNAIVDCRVNFIIIPTNSVENANVYVASDFGTLPNTTPLSAAIPGNNGGNPGSQVKINLDYPNLSSLSVLKKKLAVMHELGHILGFVHTDGRLTGEVNASPGWIGIGETSIGEDPTSLMNAALSPSVIGFSSDDIKATKYIYPEIYSINDFIKYPTEGITVYGGSGTIDLRWRESFITSKYLKIEIFYENVLVETINNVLNDGDGWVYHHGNGNYKVKISSSLNPALYDIVNFYNVND